MSRYRRLLIALVTCLVLGLAAAPAATAVDVLNQACLSNDPTNNSAICQSAQQTGANNPITNSTLPRVARVLGVIVGIGSVITVVVGGLNYVTAGGNAEKVGRARARITYAVVGLIIALLAWAIAAFFSHRLL